MTRTIICIALILSALGFTGCKTTQTGKTLWGFHQIVLRVLNAPPSMRYFLKDGPFPVTIKEDFLIRVTNEQVVTTDLFLANHDDQSPLVILQHGNRADRFVHRRQAKRLASWGFHCLTVSQPNQFKWLENGKTLAQLVGLLQSWPQLIGKTYSARQIILVGHSFGGSAASIAAAIESDLGGLILLDPALYHKKVKEYLQKVAVPTILLGADPKVFRSRKRAEFFANIAAEMVEVSIANTTHNDAQYPNQFDFSQFIGLKQAPQRDKQELFTSAIVASAFSLVATESTELAWEAFQAQQGLFVEMRRKLEEQQYSQLVPKP